MPINNSYNEAAIVEAIATALDNFYTNLIKKVDSLNVKTVMKRKNPYLFRANTVAVVVPSPASSLVFLCPRRKKRSSAMYSLSR